MRKFELDYLPPSATTGDYPGAFPPLVDVVIRQLVKGKVLHLFSWVKYFQPLTVGPVLLPLYLLSYLDLLSGRPRIDLLNGGL